MTDKAVTIPPAARARFGEGPVSGAAVVMSAKLVGLMVSLLSLAALGRLLSPVDYGVVSMVTSVTAFMTVFSDLGLSLVTVQKKDLTQQQASALFWINQAFGFLLFGVATALAPALAWFYQDDRLVSVTIAIGTVFPLMSLSIQHQALLKREMRFRHLALARLTGTVGGCLLAVLAAWRGLGYWALVVQPISSALLESIATVIVKPWRPLLPRRCEGMAGMLRFGGNLAGHGMVGYFSNNLDNILLGRVWGSHELGLYAACYGLMMRPIAIAGYSIGETAIPSMCREASNDERQRAVYRRMLTLTALVGLPILLGGALCADDVVRVVLGPQWTGAAPILSMLLIAAVPRLIWTSTGWIYVSTGRPARMFQWQLMFTPMVVLAFLLGLSGGARGVATAYAAVNWIGAAPAFAFCLHGSIFRSGDVMRPLLAPFACAATACLVAVTVQTNVLPHLEAGVLRLFLRVLVAAVTYFVAVFLWVPMAGESMRRLIARRAPSTSTII